MFFHGGTCCVDSCTCCSLGNYIKPGPKTSPVYDAWGLIMRSWKWTGKSFDADIAARTGWVAAFSWLRYQTFLRACGEPAVQCSGELFDVSWIYIKPSWPSVPAFCYTTAGGTITDLPHCIASSTVTKVSTHSSGLEGFTTRWHKPVKGTVSLLRENIKQLAGAFHRCLKISRLSQRHSALG